MNHINIAITAAFMWEGVKEDDKLLEHWDQGCIELCRAVAEFAELSELYLEAVFGAADIYFEGVYDYEVSEPFGEWLRKHIEAQDPAGERGAPRINKHVAAADLYVRVWEFFMRSEYKRTDGEQTAVMNALTWAQEKWLES
jgi:hypothetical protein